MFFYRFWINVIINSHKDGRIHVDTALPHTKRPEIMTFEICAYVPFFLRRISLITEKVAAASLGSFFGDDSRQKAAIF